MTLFQNKYRISSTRLKNWDYSSAGFYFVTICTRGREYFFGDVVNGEVKLTEIGDQAKGCWEEIPNHFAHATLDECVVMPNHVHGIVVLEGRSSVETQSFVETRHIVPLWDGASLRKGYGAHRPNQFGGLRKGSLSVIINHYKGAVTRWCNRNDHTHFDWQERFHEHIIRDDADLNRIRKYIAENPARWDLDKDSEEGLWM